MRPSAACLPLLCLLLCLLMLCPNARAQLASFDNPGFETGDLTSWSTSVPTGATATLAVTSGTTNGNPGSGSVIHSGTHAFQANVVTPGSNYPSLTHSSFTANANSTYMVSFWLWSGGNQQVNRPNMKLHIRSTGGSPYDVLFQPSSVGWDEFHWTFKASGATTISFTFEQAATFNVDDVRVFDQTDAGMDVATQYVWQWGFQGTNSSTNSTTRKTCWTGGDNDIAVQLPDGRTMWFFNDSFIGGINFNSNLRLQSGDSATDGFSFVRNYVAFQSVDKQTLTPIITSPGTFFLPSQADQNNGGIYWPNDAILEGSKVQILFDEPSNGGPGPLIAKRIGTLSPPSYNSPTYTTSTFGNFVLNGGDGYMYIYDTDNKGGMTVARAVYGSLTNVSAWQFWLGGTSWGAKPSTLTTVQNLHGGTRCFERMGPNNYLAGGNNGNDFQFAQYPWGPWTSIKRYSPVDVTVDFYQQMSNNYYYYFILHKELAQNGVYTVGYCDNGGDKKNAAGAGGEDSVDNSGYFSMDQKSKGYYAPRYIKSNNLLAVSPYTTTTFAESFDNVWEGVWWQPYGGTWNVGGGRFQQIDSSGSFYTILKGLLEGNLSYSANVACNNGTGSGLVFRASTYSYGADNYLGYTVLLKPGVGVVLSASTGNGGNVTLAQNAMTIAAGTTYKVKVVAYGTSIQVYVNDMGTALLNVTDGTYATGGIGVRTERAGAAFDNLAVQALTAPPPTIASFTPASGTAGTTVTIRGANFVSPLSVTFAGTNTPATVNLLMPTNLAVVVPSGAQTGPITVTTANGTATSATPFTIGLAPAITSSTSASGKVGQSFSYTITASNSPTSYAASPLPANLGVDAASGVISGTPTTAGTFSVTIKASNAYGTGQATLTLSVQAQASYADWRNTYFTAAQLQDPSVSGPSATPAGDGITNLMKYALNLDPNVSGTGSLPVASWVSDGAQRYLALTYTQVIGATDLTYAVQVSGDLQQWNAGSGYTAAVSAVNNADNRTQTVTVRDLTPASPDAKRFIRLGVSTP